MAEYIGCRNCKSPDCKGCNLKNLETMLNNGKFDCLMCENHCINPAADVAPVRHARWVKIYENGEPKVEQHQVGVFCSKCINMPKDRFTESDYCPNCGAKMDKGESNAKPV